MRKILRVALIFCIALMTLPLLATPAKADENNFYENYGLPIPSFGQIISYEYSTDGQTQVATVGGGDWSYQFKANMLHSPLCLTQLQAHIQALDHRC